jgi:hypothetical protein
LKFYAFGLRVVVSRIPLTTNRPHRLTCPYVAVFVRPHPFYRPSSTTRQVEFPARHPERFAILKVVIRPVGTQISQYVKFALNFDFLTEVVI